MRIKCIACDVLARPVYLAAAHSSHVVDVVFERFGLHINPKIYARFCKLILTPQTS